jgi:hypothetical protein
MQRVSQSFAPIQWWGYLHADGSVVVKRYLGDVRDYTEDCEGNDFVQYVVRPFECDNRSQALARVTVEVLKWKTR